MNKKYRIGILGIGGVGGYFGGLLAKRYVQSEEAEVIFIVRPTTEQVIREKGLTLITPQSESIIHPDLVSGDPARIGKLDLLIVCTKSYDLEESLLKLKDCITSETMILPLLNGVDANERIHKLFPDANVPDGCVYIVSRLIEPGVVKEIGNIHTLYFGSDTIQRSKMEVYERLFLNAGIEATLSDDIQKTIWEKFLFISSIASLTSFLDLNIGSILESASHRKALNALINELNSLARAKGIVFPDDIVEKTIAKMERLPFETTSSMHSDFQKGGRTEYMSLTGYVVKAANELNLNVPTFERIFFAFNNKMD